MGGSSDPLGNDRPKEDFLAQIQEAKKRGKLVAVGGPTHSST